MSIYDEYEFAFDHHVTDTAGNKRFLTVCADLNSYEEIDEILVFDDREIVPIPYTEYLRLQNLIYEYQKQRLANV
jgi:hypothetical protein